MKIKTQDLTGDALDWAVAKLEEPNLTVDTFKYEWERYNCAASIDWAQAGPIIERERVALWADVEGGWLASADEGRGKDFHAATALIAAMRCYVASKLGDEVEVPDAVVAS